MARGSSTEDKAIPWTASTSERSKTRILKEGVAERDPKQLALKKTFFNLKKNMPKSSLNFLYFCIKNILVGTLQ